MHFSVAIGNQRPAMRGIVNVDYRTEFSQRRNAVGTFQKRWSWCSWKMRLNVQTVHWQIVSLTRNQHKYFQNHQTLHDWSSDYRIFRSSRQFYTQKKSFSSNLWSIRITQATWDYPQVATSWCKVKICTSFIDDFKLTTFMKTLRGFEGKVKVKVSLKIVKKNALNISNFL